MATPVASRSSVRRLRLAHAGQLGAQGGNFGGIDPDAGAAALGRHVADVEGAPGAGDHRAHAAGVAFVGGASAGQFFPDRVVEQLEPARHGIGRAFGLHRTGIGMIDEAERAMLVARPDRRGQRFDQRAQRIHFAQELRMPGRQLGKFAAHAADIAQPHHGAAADRAAFRFQRASDKVTTAVAKLSPSSRKASTNVSMVRACAGSKPRCRRRARDTARKSA